MLATLGCMIGRSERAAPDVEGYWEKGSTFPNFLYRCADGELIQVWFGGKGMYPALLEALGDEPSEEGYYADQVAGALIDRAVGGGPCSPPRPADVWIERLRAVGVACEPVFGPGEALADPHLAEIGLAVDAHRRRPPRRRGRLTRSRCGPLTDGGNSDARPSPTRRRLDPSARRAAGRGLLGLRRRARSVRRCWPIWGPT